MILIFLMPTILGIPHLVHLHFRRIEVNNFEYLMLFPRLEAALQVVLHGQEVVEYGVSGR